MRRVATILVALTAACCGLEEQRLASLDNGRTIINGAPMIVRAPIRVDCECSTIPCADLVQAASWWNSQVFNQTRRGPVILVQMGQQGDHPTGCFVEDDLPPGYLSEESGSWVGGQLAGRWLTRIQRGRARQGIIRHAMGHALGLDEDPPTSVTLDLRSVMQSDAPEYGVVTARDAVEVVRYLEAR